MDEGGRKEEPPLPPDYVSLAQLQERWLQKQEERKLKQKQEEDEKRERNEWAQKEKNHNQREHAKTAGGFVKGTGVILDKGKGKEIVHDGPVNGGEYDKRREVIRGGKTRYFKRTTVVEDRANESVGGDGCEGVGIVAADAKKAGISTMGSGGGDGVETCNMFVVEVLPCNGVMEEIANVKKTDLRGGLRGFGRNCVSHRDIELEQSEMGLNLAKKVENVRDSGQNGRGRRRRWGRGKDGRRRERLKGDKADAELEKKTEDEISEVHSEIGNLCVVDGNKAEEDIFEREGSNGDKMAPKIEKVDHEVSAVETAIICKNGGVVKGYQRNENQWRKERRHRRPEIAAEKDRIEGEDSNGDKVALEIEKKVDHDFLSGESEKIGENREVVKGNRKNENRRRDYAKGRRYARPNLSPKEDRNEGKGSNGNIVALEIEKMDHEVLAGESAKTGGKRWVVKGYKKNEDQRRDFGQDRRFPGPEISVEEDRIVGENSNGNKVRLEIEKVGHDVLAKESAKISDNRVIKGYQRNENWNCGSVQGYPRNGIWNSGFCRGKGRGHARSEISNRRWKMNSGVNGTVWVKKEEKLGDAAA